MGSLGFKKNINPLGLGLKVTGVIVGLWVTSMMVTIMKSVLGTGATGGAINDVNGTFYAAYQFLGLTTANPQGILTIAGIFIALAILTEIVDLKI